MFKHNIAIVINKQRITSNKTFPLRIRLTVKRKVTYYSTGIMIALEHWDDAKKEVIKHPNKSLLNTSLRQQLADLEKSFLEQSISGHTEKKIVKDLLFYNYALKKINETRPTDSVATYKQKYSKLKKFNEFKTNVKLQDITGQLSLEYENYCRTNKNCNNTIWNATKFLKMIINTAIREKVLLFNPMAGFVRTPYKSPQIEFLTEGEINKLEDFSDNTLQNETLRNVAAWFVFSCYSGLRYSDAATFSSKKIIDNKIIIRTQKSKSDVSIKIFPLLQKAIDRLVQPIISNQKINYYIKMAAVACNITKPVNYHMSRHTFAVMYLNRGGTMENLSKLLGHSNIRTTQIYGKITNKRLDDEIDKIFG